MTSIIEFMITLASSQASGHAAYNQRYQTQYTIVEM